MKARHSAGFRLYHRPEHAKPSRHHNRAMRAASLFLAAACLLLSVSVYPATAATSMSSLQNKLNKLSQSIEQHKKELSDAKKKEQAAKALESELKEKVTVVQSQIGVLKSQIAVVQNSIGVKEQEIAAKEQEITAKKQEITAKQGEIDTQWTAFKGHMAAMQELREGGTVAMLSSVTNLYELLTFNQALQDISVKDTEILTNMRNAKEALENDKAQLEEQKTQLNSQRAELQSKKSELDSQNAQMTAKQSELNSSVAAAKLSAAEAQKAQKDAQAAIESDEMNYEAVKKEVQKLIAAAASSKPQLSFTGFICPLKSYTRISSEYGWRKNPVSGVNKLHAGTDRPGGHPHLRSRQRLCAGGGLVQRRLRQLCHHLPRQNVRWPAVQHPVRPYEVGGYLGGQVCPAGRTHRLCGFHRQLHRQPPPPRSLEGRFQGQCRES